MSDSEKVKELVRTAFSARPIPMRWALAGEIMQPERCEELAWDIISCEDHWSLFILGQVMLTVAENPSRYQRACEALIDILSSCADCDGDGSDENDYTGHVRTTARQLFSGLSRDERHAVVEWLQLVKPCLSPWDGHATSTITYWSRQEHDGPFN